jgi:HD-like signal output (HDOD) protein
MASDDAHNDMGQGTLSNLELRCPPLPQTLTEALDIMHSPERMEVRPVTEMVERDPGVVARLLQTVNSAYYGLQRSVSSTRRAVVMLGPVAVTGLVVGMNMLKLRSIIDGPARDAFIRLIRHNIGVAYLTRHLFTTLAPRSSASEEDMSDPLTAGLLHDFGKIILVYNFPDEAIALYEGGELASQVHHPNERVMEQLVFGYDHTEAGEFTARKLNFPEPLTDVIRAHHDVNALEAQTEQSRLFRAVTAANLAAKAMGHAFSEELSWDEALEHPVWALLLEYDLPNLADIQDLKEALQVEKPRLDAYVTHMSVSASDATSDDSDTPYPPLGRAAEQ